MDARFWICVFIIVLAVCFMLINKKIRCSRLFVDVFKIFYDNRTNKISIVDLIAFFLCPIVIGICSVIGFNYYFSLDVSKCLLTIFSIVFTLLFGVLSLLMSTLNSVDETKKKISKEAFTAVSFAMLSSLITLILLIIYIIFLEQIQKQTQMQTQMIIIFKIITGAIVSISINMIMLFFMIIKRTYVTSSSEKK